MAKKQQSSDDKVMAMLPHLLSIFTGFIGPLIIYLVNQDKKNNKYVFDNAKHALNFQISLIIYMVISFILVFVIIGIPMLIALSIFALVFEIIATVRSYNGEIYTYPLEIPFIK